MKIKRKTETVEKVPFRSLKGGQVFDLDGELYLAAGGSAVGVVVVELETGNFRYLYDLNPLVRVVNGSFVRNEMLKIDHDPVFDPVFFKDLNPGDVFRFSDDNEIRIMARDGKWLNLASFEVISAGNMLDSQVIRLGATLTVTG